MPERMTKPYYAAESFELRHMDCVEFMSSLPAESVQMIFADPPYNLSNGGFSCHAGRRVSVNKGTWDKSKGLAEDFDFHQRWIDACRHVLTPSGTIWISGTYHSIYACGYALQLTGFHMLNDIAWYKPNAAPNLSTRFFTASHETLIWARKSKDAKHIFNYGAMKNGDWPGDSIKRPGKQMRSVWAITTPPPDEKRFGKHPTQKPLALLNRIVLASTNPGDLILDPFTGSSTTGLSAFSNGRRFIGVDTEEKYLALSVKRFESLSMIAKEKKKQTKLPVSGGD